MPFDTNSLPPPRITLVEQKLLNGKAISDSRLTVGAKLTFSILLSGYVNTDGACWPTHNMLARLTCQTRRAVVSQIKLLVETGYLAYGGYVGQARRMIVPRTNIPPKDFYSRQSVMGGDPTREDMGVQEHPMCDPSFSECENVGSHDVGTQLRTPCDPSFSQNRVRNRGTGTEEQEQRNRKTSFVGKPTAPPASSTRPPIEPSDTTPTPEVTVARKTKPKNPDTTAASKTDLFGDAPKPEPKTSLLDEAVQIWHEVVVPKGIPDIRKLTDKRRKKLALRINDLDGIEGWRDLCLQIAASDFLTGKNNKDWTPNFDWVLEPGNILKIQEGTYKNKLTPAQRAAKDLERRNQMAREMESTPRVQRSWAEIVEAREGQDD